MFSKSRSPKRLAAGLVALAVATLGPAAQAATISLASSMDPATGLSENAVSGAQARIGFGTGAPGDADGLYDINTAAPFGAIDVFPNEEAFGVGSLDFNGASVTGSGVEVVAIDSIDLSSLWASGSSTTDISDAGLNLWFFGLPTSFTFGALDAADTLTFTNGLLTSIDLSITATFGLFDAGSNPVDYDGTFSISGATIDLAISDTENFDTGIFGVVPSTFESNLTGTVSAVNSFSVPEPGLALLLGSGLALIAHRRRSG